MHTDSSMKAGGHTLRANSNWLHKNKMHPPTGKACWVLATISKPLRNVKYVGDVLLQKAFVQELLSGRQIKNNDELEKFLILEYYLPQVGNADFLMGI